MKLKKNQINKISKILLIVIEIVFIILIIVAISVLWNFHKYLDDIPYDNLTTYVEDIKCKETWCNVTFKSGIMVKHVIDVVPTGSQLPLLGGNDKFVCVNLTDSVPRQGDTIVARGLVHSVYSIRDGWVLTKGINNYAPDNYKFPIDKIECVIALISR